MRTLVITLLLTISFSAAWADSFKCSSIDTKTKLGTIYLYTGDAYGIVSFLRNLSLKQGGFIRGDYYMRETNSGNGYMLNADPYFTGTTRQEEIHYWMWFGKADNGRWPLEIFQTRGKKEPDLTSLYSDLFECKKI